MVGYNEWMTKHGQQLLTKLNAINDSFVWIEQQADALMLEFEILMEKFETDYMEEEDFDQMSQIERRMTELENRAKINTQFYNTSVDEARKYFKQYYNTDLPPGIRKLI